MLALQLSLRGGRRAATPAVAPPLGCGRSQRHSGVLPAVPTRGLAPFSLCLTPGSLLLWRAPQVIAKFKGADLKGRTYEPLFPYFAHMKGSGAFKVSRGWQSWGCSGGVQWSLTAARRAQQAWRLLDLIPVLPAPPPVPPRPCQVVTDAYVSADSGVGIVHQAPAFGARSARLLVAGLARGSKPASQAGWGMGQQPAVCCCMQAGSQDLPFHVPPNPSPRLQHPPSCSRR